MSLLSAFLLVTCCLPVPGFFSDKLGSSRKNAGLLRRRSLETLNLTSREDKCNQITGGECFIFGCDDTRGGKNKVECVEGYCLCKEGFCAVKGACIKAPAKDNTDKFFTIVHNAIRSQLEPSICMQVAGLNGTKAFMGPCGAAPIKFELPIGPVGQLKAMGMCLQLTWVLGVLRTAESGNKPDIMLDLCDINKREQQFHVPKGGLGQIRSDYDRSLCLEALRDGTFTPIGMPVPLNALGFKDCSDKLEQNFGLAKEPPEPDLPCASQGDCAKLKQKSGKLYCKMATGSPYCQAMMKCPPGGCSNGECWAGICQCNVGFMGATCQDPVPGPVS